MTKWAAAFAADLHLQGSDPRGRSQAVQLLEMCVQRTRQLYFLGDLFDFWTSSALLRLAELDDVYSALRSAAERGLEIFFLPGNRDFNLSVKTGRELGMQVRGEECEFSAEGHRALLTHGDCFLLNDVSYQRLKRVIRSWPMRFVAQRLPGAISIPLARRLRRFSRQAVARKESDRFRIVPEAVEEKLERGFDTVLCGHVHRADRLDFDGGGRLLVLPAFQHEARFAVLEGGEFKLCDLAGKTAEFVPSGRRG